MSQEDYATFNYLIAVITVLAQVCTFGLYVPQSKLFHDVNETERGTLLLTISVLLVALLVLTLLPTYAFGWDRKMIQFLFSGTIAYERYRYVIPLGVILAVCAHMTVNYFLTREQVEEVQRYNLLRLGLGAFATIGALYCIAGDSAAVRLIAYLGAELVAFLTFIRHFKPLLRGKVSTSLARKSLALGLPIMGSAILGIIINFGDKFFIEKFCNLADMAVYFLGLTFASVVSIAFMAFQNVWLPSFLKEKDLATNLKRTRRVIQMLLLCTLILAAAIWLSVACAFQLQLIKPGYGQVLYILPVQLLATICTSIVAALSVYTIYWEMTYVTIITGTAVAIVSVPMNYLAAKYYGIYGIAVVSVVVNVLYAGMYYGYVRYRASALMYRKHQ